MKWNPHALAAAAHGTLYTLNSESMPVPAAGDLPDQECLFSNDTRAIAPGAVFVALQGEQSDGHAYLASAFEKGAAGVIISDLARLSQPDIAAILAQRPESFPKPFAICVADPLCALQAIARANRQKHPIPTAGVTGSNGKTTVKDMTAAILATRFNVLKSYKSFNNHIGLPLTLANMTANHDVAVLEMGMNAPGELTHLAGIAQPDVGLITNIARAHFGFFHSIDAIMQAKMELIRALPSQAIAVLNADDDLFEAMRRDVAGPLITFGLAATNGVPTITARRIQANADATYTFDLHTPDGSIAINLPLPGQHNVLNALAAAAVVYALTRITTYDRIQAHQTSDSKLEMIKQGLEHFTASPMRMQVVSHNGVTFINDAYNANPNSMASALRTLKARACSGKKIAVLGDMFELGEISAAAHAEVGALAVDAPVDHLLLLGEYAQDTARGAREARGAGATAAKILIAGSHSELATLLADIAGPGDLVLIKASRGMALERVLDEYLKLVKCRA